MDIAIQPTRTNIRKTCRTCLRVVDSRKDLLSITDVDQTYQLRKLKISVMLASVTNLKPEENDALPKRICISCLCQVRSAFFFKEQAENAHNVLVKQLEIELKNLVGEVKRETESQAIIGKIDDLADKSVCIEPDTMQENSTLLSNSEADDYGNDDMLVEIENPKVQEQFCKISGEKATVKEQEENSDDDDENGSAENRESENYMPDTSDSDSSDNVAVMAEQQASNCMSEKSPDSGISDEFNKLFSTSFNERQLAESKLLEIQDLVCDICNKQMFSRKSLSRHKTRHHTGYRCQFCKKKFSNSSHLKLHTRYKHPQKLKELILNGQTNPVVQIEPIATIPECDSCGIKFCDLDALRRHHADCDRKCIECGAKFLMRSLYFLHLENDHNIKLAPQLNVLECPFGCSDKFTTEKVLQDHVQQFHPEDVDSVADTFSEDGESVSSEASVECEICHHRFLKQRSLTQHMSVMHKASAKEQVKTRNHPKYTKDEFVDKFMVTKSNEFTRCIPCKKDIFKKSLLVHLRTKHASVKSYRCELCPEAFFRPDYRQRHMSYLHQNSFRCNRCNVQFDRAYKYDAHMTDHGIKAKNFKPDSASDHYDLPMANIKYIEDISTYDYSVQDPKTRRMSILGPVSTPVEVALPREEFMERYLVSISDKQSNCTACQQTIMKSSIFTHLLWKHAVKKPLKCAFCNERTVKANGRLGHMARCHSKEYTCSDCREQFAKHADLAYHMSNLHNKTLTTSPSSGEEPDLSSQELRFIAQKNEEEIIEEAEMVSIDPDINLTLINDSVNSKLPKNPSSYKRKDHSGETSSSECSLEPMRFEDFRRHFIETINSTDVKCLVCDQTLKKKNLGNHLKARHATIGAFKCAVCPEAFFRPEHRMQHMAQSHSGMYFCQTCNIQFYRNSRFAKHMKDLHEIDLDNNDEYEVDLGLVYLKFIPVIKKSQDDDQNSSSLAQVQEPEAEATEKSVNDPMNRDDFLSEYIKIVNKESRRCLACDKTFAKTSMYHHLMRYHAITPPFKCPFCDLRLERAANRVRHLQVFHPDEYKCQTCGIQFQKHAPYVDHMMIEHNEVITTPKAEGEENDLSTLDIKYLPFLAREDSYWQEEESMLDATSFSAPRDTSSPSIKQNGFLKPTSLQKDGDFVRPQIKEEPNDTDYLIEHSIFGNDLLSNEVDSRTSETKKEYNYADFKCNFLRNQDSLYAKCVPCKRTFLKGAVSSHMRIYHALTTCYNCELCPEGFRRGDARMRHMKFAHENDFKCSHCQTQFNRSKLFKMHMRDFHKMSSDIQELKTKEELDVPLESMRFVETLPEQSEIVDGEVRKRWSRVVRSAINPEAGGFTFNQFVAKYIESTGDAMSCKICGPGQFFLKYNLRKHLKRSHATTPSFFCELCPEGFNKPSDRTAHMEAVHKDDFKCVHCNIQFYMSTSYVEHMKETHRVTVTLTAAKPRSEIDVPMERLRFLAEKICEDTSLHEKSSPGSTKGVKQTYDEVSDDAELTRQEFYGKFLRSLKERGKTRCLACEKVFSTKNRLFHIWQNHATMRPHNCEFCPRGFFQLTKRLRHMGFKHKGANTCSECVIQFDRTKTYAKHMLSEHNVTVEVPAINDDDIDVPAEKWRFTKKQTSLRVIKEGQASVSSPVLPQPFPQGPMKCNDCNVEFDSSRAYRNHLRNQLCGVNPEVQEPVMVKEPVLEEEPVQKREPSHLCDICERKFLTPYALISHKRFKHNLGSNRFRSTNANMNNKVGLYDVHCDICEFTSHRRDYVEHHVSKVHKPEFNCQLCSRVMSNYNYYMHHVSEQHPKADKTIQMSHKCSICEKGFRSEKTLQTHIENKHQPGVASPEHFCAACGVSFKSPGSLDIHKKGSYHCSVTNFIETLSNVVPEESIVGKVEETESHSERSSPDTDPLERMLARKLRSSTGPPAKRPRLNSPSSSSSWTTVTTDDNNDDGDKLDYLKYIQINDGVFKCAICNQTKKVRKYMLHHLKQHEEVPTYDCGKCSEKFLFKKKFESHLKSHEIKIEDIRHSDDDSVEEHPKFQETSVRNEIKCQICQLSFKLTIMMNRHNAIWHDEGNLYRDLPMSDQKAKRAETKQELPVIKLLKCSDCQEAFLKPEELKEHLKTHHEPENEAEKSPAEEEPKTASFACEKCKIVFHEKKFLENHQKIFCIYRHVMNEQ